MDEKLWDARNSQDKAKMGLPDMEFNVFDIGVKRNTDERGFDPDPSV